MKKVLALVLSSLLVATPAFADRTMYAPVRLAPVATAGTVLFGDGTAAAPSMSFSADPDTGIFRETNNRIAISAAGTQRFTISGYAAYIGNGLASASPQPGGVFATGGSGTNISGANLSINGGQSTGTGSGGAILFQTSAAGSSGSLNNALTERMRIDSAGKVIVNHTSSIPLGQISSQVQVSGTDAATGSMSIARYSASAFGPYFSLGKSRGATNGSMDIVQSGDTLATLNFVGADGANLAAQSAAIEAIVDGSPAAGSVPGRLIFRTTAVGGTSSAERMRIMSTGQIQVGDGTAAAPVLSFSADTDTGIFRQGGDQIAIATGGLSRLSIANNTVYVGGNAAGSSTPIGGSISGVFGVGTNIAGANLTISGGNSTGTGAGGALIFQTAAAGSSGSTANTLTERMRVKQGGQIRFIPLAADPAGAENGDVYYNSATNKLRVRAGGAWVDLH